MATALAALAVAEACFARAPVPAVAPAPVVVVAVAAPVVAPAVSVAPEAWTAGSADAVVRVDAPLVLAAEREVAPAAAVVDR